MDRLFSLVAGFSLSAALLAATSTTAHAAPQQQDPPGTPAPPTPNVPGEEKGSDDQAVPAVKPLTEGPLHEAFLSPARDRDPFHVSKSPPAPIVERPGVDAPDPRAQWIDGYWEWDAGRNDFTWVTGTWRVPPPGKFWVNGYWKRDDQGWYRVAGFWSDRKTDRIDFRKEGPPADHPADEPGESPGDEYFYVPGQYFPDGNGVVWKPGFWASKQPGWAWVPAQWIRQPEGWAFQEGYWDRTLEDRGTLFAPAEVADASKQDQDLVYQPYTQISPQSYGLLYGAFGRPDEAYDGYPGCYYDASGRYYGYAQYGSIGSYYGYLDYPYYGTVGYPYLASPISYGYGYGGFGYGGFGFGYPLFGGFGFGYPFWGGFGFGYPFFGGFGFGYPFWGGIGWGGWGGGWGGGWNGPWRGPGWRHHYPFYPGGNHGGGPNGGWNGHHRTIVQNPPGNHPIGRSPNLGMPSRVTNGPLVRHSGVQPPPSSRPYANPFAHHATNLGTAHRQANVTRAVGGPGQGNLARGNANAGVRHGSAVAGPLGNGWTNAFNGGHAATVRHAAARPAFGANTTPVSRVGTGGGFAGGVRSNPVMGSPAGNLGASRPISGIHQGTGPALGGLAGSRPLTGTGAGMHPGGSASPLSGLGSNGPAVIHRGPGGLGATAGGIPGLGTGVGAGGIRHTPSAVQVNPGAGRVGGGGIHPGGLGGIGTSAPMHRGGGFAPSVGGGFGGGGVPRGGLSVAPMGGGGGFSGGRSLGGGGFSAPHMGGGFSGGGFSGGGFRGGSMGGAGHVGGFSGGGGHVGGFSGGGGHVGGFSGGHGGGGHR
ncbi:MAG: hypothetical protein U0835_04445 [Isosphaeraceae bacterium]